MTASTVTEHREGDESQSDYRSQRSLSTVIVRRLNGHTKWIVAAVGAAILGMAAWAFNRIATDAASALAISNSNSATIGIIQAQSAGVAAILSRIEDRQIQQGEDLAALKAQVRRQRDTGRD